MPKLYRTARTENQKEIVKIFGQLGGRHSLWQLWADAIVMIACAISNAVDKAHWDEREKAYLSIAKKYTKEEMDCFVRIYALLVNAYEFDADQDLLGELYMNLGLGNDHNGQFFTPYDVCKMMALMNIDHAERMIQEKGWIAVNDPAVGAGALLIAFANACKDRKINYQQSVLFTAQELDYVTACMCYIQLSLMGCPGYVYIGNTLTDPCVSLDGRALIPKPSDKLWFTPMYFHEIWHYRRIWSNMDLMLQHSADCGREKPAIEEKTIPQAPAPVQELKADKNGQLMLF